MSKTIRLVDERRGNEKEFDTLSEAEEKKNDLISLGANPEDISIEIEGEEPSPDGGEAVEAEVVDHAPDEESRAEPASERLPDETPNVDEDPVNWMPSHFVDNIQGTPTVNRKGYAVIASEYGVSVSAEPITLASDTDFEYAEFRAVAETEDGQTYSGMGSAHVDRDDGDGEHILNELAETRAMKRATAWATGVGMTAVEELQNEL